MSILIKDMEMPKSCKSCDLLQDYDGDMYCPLNDYLNFGDIENVPDYVMIGCPLSAQPEIIRCKDCKHRHLDGMIWNCPFGLSGGEDFFCAYGAKDGDSNDE